MINPYVGICFLLFVVLLLMEVPIPFGMIASSILYSVLNGESLVLLPSKIATSYSDWSMLAVPAFLFVGTFMNEMGLTDRIFGFAEAWLGRVTGGLAHANVLASMLFAGMSGSALADAGGLGVIEVHEGSGIRRKLFRCGHRCVFNDRADHPAQHQPGDLGMAVRNFNGHVV